jgi:hypothetical protein
LTNGRPDLKKPPRASDHCPDDLADAVLLHRHTFERLQLHAISAFQQNRRVLFFRIRREETSVQQFPPNRQRLAKAGQDVVQDPFINL